MIKLLLLFLTATCLKILLVPSYHSTDFDVHRNWMAITYNLPLKGTYFLIFSRNETYSKIQKIKTDWYHEHTSEWTLDYPPFFAYFEYILSKFAFLAGDPHILDIRADPYGSVETVWYQRFTVIVSDVVLFLAVTYVMLSLCLNISGVILFILLEHNNHFTRNYFFSTAASEYHKRTRTTDTTAQHGQKRM